MKRLINADDLLKWMDKVELTEDGGIDFNILKDYINNAAVIRKVQTSGLISKEDAIMAICRNCTDDGEYYHDCKMFKTGICADVVALNALPEAEALSKIVATIKIDKDELLEACVDRLREEYGAGQEAQREPGKWMHVRTVHSNETGVMMTHNTWECSICDHEGNPDWPFCPHCGTEMSR